MPVRADIKWACGHHGHSQIDDLDSASDMANFAIFEVRDGCAKLACWYCRAKYNNDQAAAPKGVAQA